VSQVITSVVTASHDRTRRCDASPKNKLANITAALVTPIAPTAKSHGENDAAYSVEAKVAGASNSHFHAFATAENRLSLKIQKIRNASAQTLISQQDRTASGENNLRRAFVITTRNVFRRMRSAAGWNAEDDCTEII
jgi:hypothetical protein